MSLKTNDLIDAYCSKGFWHNSIIVDRRVTKNEDESIYEIYVGNIFYIRT